MLKAAAAPLLLLLACVACTGDDADDDGGQTTDQAFSTTWTLAYGQHKPTQIAVDATHVYWTAYPPSDDVPPFVHHHDILRVKKTGGGAIEKMASAETSLVTFTVDSSHIYWLTQSSSCAPSGSPGTGSAKRMSKTDPGGTVEVLATDLPCGSPSVNTQMVVDAANLWFSGDGGIRMLPKDGGGGTGAVTLVAPAGPNPHASMTSSVLLREDADAIYWGDSYGPLWAQQKSSGAKVKLLDESPRHAALDASFLYFVEDAKVWRVAKQGNAPAEEIGPAGGGFGSASGIAVDDTHVYYSSTRENAVRRISKTPGSGSGSQSFAIAETAFALAIDADNVFFPHFGTQYTSFMAPQYVDMSGAIRRRTKQ